MPTGQGTWLTIGFVNCSAKQHALDQGGKITHEYSLIKGFA
jgi:hypothetical protein